jgi:hypothetical protein
MNGSHGAMVWLPMGVPLVRNAVTVKPIPVAVAPGGQVCALATRGSLTNKEIIAATNKVVLGKSQPVFVSIQLFPVKKFSD